MSWLSRDARTEETTTRKGLAGAVAGLLGGIGMGLILHVGSDILPIFGHFVGNPTVGYGWLVHLFTSVLFGLLFVVFVSLPFIHDISETFAASVLLGVIHASVLATAMIAIGLPVITTVLSTLGATAGEIPGVTLDSFVEWLVFGISHLVYGVILGAVYAVLREPT